MRNDADLEFIIFSAPQGKYSLEKVWILKVDICNITNATDPKPYVLVMLSCLIITYKNINRYWAVDSDKILTEFHTRQPLL